MRRDSRAPGARGPGATLRALLYALTATSAFAGPAAAQRPPESPSPPPSRRVAPASCTVARVIDGDTLECREAGRVRLLLIDTPERDQEPFGAAARDALVSLAPPGAVLVIETDVQSHDRYGRLLAYLTDAEGRLVNEELLRLGMAVVAVYPPNVRHFDRFRAVAAAARRGRVGLWGVDGFDCAPADHRAGRC